MKRGATGRYETSTSGGDTVRAFIPAPLPPDPMLDLKGERQRLLERALLACGRLDGVRALLPDPNLFLYACVRREAVLSSQVEGTQSSNDQPLERLMREASRLVVNIFAGQALAPSRVREPDNPFL
jgi:hypothetical protein